MVKYWESGLFIAFVAVVGFYFAFSSMGARAAKTVPVGAQPVSVDVAKVKTADIPNTVNALGSLSAVKVVTISAESDGRIAEIHFKSGQEVDTGMPIVQLDNAQAQADYQSAVTAMKLARTKYERSKLLLNQAISQQELAALKADMESKEASVQSKLAALNEKVVNAPFSGVLGAFQVQVGDYVKAGDPLVTLVNTSQLRADFQVPENFLPELKQGQLVTITTGTCPQKTFYGTVSFISPMVSSDTRSISIQALVPNDKELLSPGMFVHVSQQISVAKNAPVIPEEAIQADVKGYYVYKVVGDKVGQTYIKVGTRVDNQAQVLSGLNIGDTIVVAGQQKLDDGSVIKVQKDA
ncbi:efflux transporter periplasmic adaptor subunit [Coxiella burnetii]|uniref:efflux RND transporter periplasmic adaptor subunit n=1 Tax=Coxiella burnetii TaxID=777 RepID=UPI0002F65121|nr:efflux RND transporter periplasmic adaptor subunit [Coxiella burnetii]AML49109.1 RND transporter MFP subunit [Coxiella burnetii]AML55046.1 efflux transporter periplasmic adaptor subunit [Coxiella burnetii]ATN69024.1 efflux transporter periplasmic adaptor subunit [Coxiella burnetii]ATN70942.1 efflux transporter periplasmic adaptor subunit [Coxiella burnetii]ATN72856.1 efflux transporter periplasmic adaptor subunit [Coxiella burnetii]